MKWFALLAVAALAGGCEAACSNGWIDINGGCFGLYTENMPWADAQTFCETEGGKLAKVADGDTLRGIYEYIVTYGIKGTFWLGASDVAYEGDWLWTVDGTRVDRGTPYWAIHNGIFGWDHEPSGGAEENCLIMDETRKYYFNDANCNLIFHPLCME